MANNQAAILFEFYPDPATGASPGAGSILLDTTSGKNHVQVDYADGVETNYIGPVLRWMAATSDQWFYVNRRFGDHLFEATVVNYQDGSTFVYTVQIECTRARVPHILRVLNS